MLVIGELVIWMKMNVHFLDNVIVFSNVFFPYQFNIN